MHREYFKFRNITQKTDNISYIIYVDWYMKALAKTNQKTLFFHILYLYAIYIIYMQNFQNKK